MLEIIFDYWYLLPLVVLGLYFLNRPFNRHRYNQKKSKKILKKLQGFEGDGKEGKIFSYLRKVDPLVFEELVLDCFQQKGYEIIRNKRYTGDGGIDGKILDEQGNMILVQSKRYDGHITLQHVKDFAIVVSKHTKAKTGFFVHTGKTGKGIYSVLKDNRNIKLISGKNLIDLLNVPTKRRT